MVLHPYIYMCVRGRATQSGTSVPIGFKPEMPGGAPRYTISYITAIYIYIYIYIYIAV